MPPLNSLRVFEAAARHLSFKKAADELHVTPAAVSHQITQLEEFLGVQLFERMHRSVALTPAAFASFGALSKGFDAIREAVSQLRVTAVAPLTVSCPPSFAHRWLFPRLYSFFSEHGDFDIQVSTQLDITRSQGRPTNMAMRMIDLAETYDVVIALGRQEHYPLHARPIMPLSVTPLCSPALLHDGRIDGPESLARLGILHDGRGPLYNEPDFWTIWLAQAGYDVDIALGGQRFTHSFLSLDAAVAGRGVVVSTPVLAQADIEAGRLVAPFDLRVPIPQAYQMIVRDARSERVEIFCDWLLASAGEERSAAA